jgi:hypothetical protein
MEEEDEDAYRSMALADFMHQNKEEKVVSKFCTLCPGDLPLYYVDKPEPAMVCRRCGLSTKTLDVCCPNVHESDAPHPVTTSRNPEHLDNQFHKVTSNASIDMPPEMEKIIKDELITRRIENYQDITPKLMMDIMKKSKKKDPRFAKYYSSVNQVVAKFTGSQPIVLPESISASMRDIIRKIKISHERIKDDGTVNFMNSHIVFKMAAKLLGLPPEICALFRSAELGPNRTKYEETARQICLDRADEGWDYEKIKPIEDLDEGQLSALKTVSTSVELDSDGEEVDCFEI